VFVKWVVDDLLLFDLALFVENNVEQQVEYASESRRRIQKRHFNFCFLKEKKKEKKQTNKQTELD